MPAFPALIPALPPALPLRKKLMQFQVMLLTTRGRMRLFKIPALEVASFSGTVQSI